jgi:hypothetical protein
MLMAIAFFMSALSACSAFCNAFRLLASCVAHQSALTHSTLAFCLSTSPNTEDLFFRWSLVGRLSSIDADAGLGEGAVCTWLSVSGEEQANWSAIVFGKGRLTASSLPQISVARAQLTQEKQICACVRRGSRSDEEHEQSLNGRRAQQHRNGVCLRARVIVWNRQE